VDRSNYSKAVNNGPITNAFLQKFYSAFGEELKKMQDSGVPVEIEEMEKMMEEMERRLDLRMKKFEKNMASMAEVYIAKIEALVSQIGRKSARSGDRGDGK